MSATNVSQFAQPKKHHGQQCVRNNVSSFTRAFSSGKSLGPDGLSAELYVKFWDLLGPYLVQVFNSCFLNSEMCDSMKVNHTRVVFRKGDAKNLKIGAWSPLLM